MDKLQASLFLLFQQSLWTDFPDFSEDQEAQKFISDRFLEIYKRVNEKLGTDIAINASFIKELNRENIRIHSEMRRTGRREDTESITRSSAKDRTSIRPESSSPEVDSAEDKPEFLENRSERSSGEGVFLISEESDDVKPIFMVGDFDSEEELLETFPDHTFRASPQGFERLRSGLENERFLVINTANCPYPTIECPSITDQCPSVIAFSDREVQLLMDTVREVVRRARERGD